MAQENVVVVRFTEPSKAYQALSVLKDCDAEGRIGLESAAVVERTAAGELRIPESADNVGLVGTASGSLIGMLVGVLGGPVGVLLGWGAGALMGGAFDVDRAVTSDEALTVLGRAIPPGSTAVIASVEEPAVEVIDARDDEARRRGDAPAGRRGHGRARCGRGGRRRRGARSAAGSAREAQGRAPRRCRGARRKGEGEAPRLLTTRASRARRSPPARTVGGLRRFMAGCQAALGTRLHRRVPACETHPCRPPDAVDERTPRDPASRPVRGSRGRDARGRGRLEASGPAGDARAPAAAAWSTSTRSSTACGARSSRPLRGTRSIITSPAFAPRSERRRSSARPTGTHSRTRAWTRCGSRSCSRRRAPRCATATFLPRRTRSRRRWPSGAGRRCRV